jgi:type II secretory pathway component PulC
VDYRLGVLQRRIDLAVNEHIELLRWLKVKIEFIEAVLDDRITFKNKTRKLVGDNILAETAAVEDDVSRLLALNILSLTSEQVDALRKEIQEAQKKLAYWQKTTPKDQYIEDLDRLES